MRKGRRPTFPWHDFPRDPRETACTVFVERARIDDSRGQPHIVLRGCTFVGSTVSVAADRRVSLPTAASYTIEIKLIIQVDSLSLSVLIAFTNIYWKNGSFVI